MASPPEIDFAPNPSATETPRKAAQSCQFKSGCSRCCESCCCFFIFFCSFLALCFTGLTQVNYRLNIGATFAKALWNPMLCVLLLGSIFAHLTAYFVGLFCPCCTSDTTKEGRKRSDTCCPLDCYPRCGGRYRRTILVVLTLNMFLVLIPIWAVTATTGHWLANGSVERIFGQPSYASSRKFSRKTPYNFVDHLFWFLQPQLNPVLSEQRTLTSTHRYKNITDLPPNPNGDALSFMTASSPFTKKYLELDLYHPKDVEGSSWKEKSEGLDSLPPVVFHIHGGAFVQFDKSFTAMPIISYQKQGYAVISIQYRLTPYGWNSWDIAEDLIDAFLWLRENDKKLQVDGTRIVMVGESAGGFASSFLCYLFSANKETWTSTHSSAAGVNGRDLLFQRIGEEKRIKGCLNMYAATELIEFLNEKVENWDMVRMRVPILTRVMLSRNRTRLGPEIKWRELMELNSRYFSCPSFVTSTSPPTLSFHGADDVVVPPSMSIRLHEALDKANVTNAISIMGMNGHNFDMGEYSAGGQVSWYAFERFLAAVMPV